jgi:hypothetical protein
MLNGMHAQLSAIFIDAPEWTRKDWTPEVGGACVRCREVENPRFVFFGVLVSLNCI